MANIIFFNKLAQLRSDPTFKNLMALAKDDPRQLDIELNDLAWTFGKDFTPKDNLLWLLAYLQGVCATEHLGSHDKALEELQDRLNNYWNCGEWRFREPYQLKDLSQLNKEDDSEPPIEA